MAGKEQDACPPKSQSAEAIDDEVAVTSDYYSNSDDSDETTNWVEMPLSHLRFVLARTRASMQAAHDEFFEYQAWVREVFLRNGRVMVPEDFLGPRDEMQRELDEVWGDGIVVESVGGGDDHNDDAEASDRTDYSSTKHQVLLQSKI